MGDCFKHSAVITFEHSGDMGVVPIVQQGNGRVCSVVPADFLSCEGKKESGSGFTVVYKWVSNCTGNVAEKPAEEGCGGFVGSGDAPPHFYRRAFNGVGGFQDFYEFG